MSSPKLVFILSTGRSGTTSIASMLNTLSGVTVEHERHPKLLTEALAYRRGSLSQSALIELLRRTRAPETFGGAVLVGESNQRLSFVLPALASAFPQAKYILLQRDGREVVDSLHHRQWYHPREAWLRHPTLAEWASTRFEGPDFGMHLERWKNLTPCARCAWYWAIVPTLVRGEASRLGLALLELRLEDLAVSRSALAQFLALPEERIDAPPRSNVSFGKRPSWRAWSPSMRASFVESCAPEMDQTYPDWRRAFVWSPLEEITGAFRRGKSRVRLGKLYLKSALHSSRLVTTDAQGNA